MRILVITWLCVVCNVGVSLSKETVTVQTEAGTFMGYVRTFTALGGTELRVRRFLGIPYAEAPVGDLRFQKPKVKAKLDGVYDATEFRQACTQTIVGLSGKRNTGNANLFSEDCLHLSIYVPDLARVKPTAVMIVIHGGGFVMASGNIHTSDIISAHGDVIVVVINYRLSLWGFMSTGDDNMPGNYGLWDQHYAIKWVHANIAAFGGDPDNISLNGQSAGAASVIYQGMFPGNKGLIRRLIAQSGSITCPWAFNGDPLTVTRRLAGLVGCTQSETKDLAECIRSKSSDELDHALNNNNGFVTFPMEFLPVVDSEFIPECPNDLFHSPSIVAEERRKLFAELDVVLGLVSNEGLMMATPLLGAKDPENFHVTRSDFENVRIPSIIKLMFGTNVPDVVKDLIIAEYTNWDDKEDEIKTRESFVRLSSEYIFHIQGTDTALLHASLSKSTRASTYFYLIDALPSQHIIAHPSWASQQPTHGDDLTFLFGHDPVDGFTRWTMPYGRNPEQWEHEVSKLLITAFRNFAKTGNPNTPVSTGDIVTWPEYTTETQHYFNISSHTTSVGAHLFARGYNFWNHLLPEVISAVGGRASTSTEGYCHQGNCSP